MSSSNSGCWVQFWDADDFDSRGKTDGPNTNARHYHKYDGPTEVMDLEEVHWPGNPHNNENNEYSSLIVGPKAWLEVYSGPDCIGERSLFGPDEKVYQLSSHRRSGPNSWDNCITSFRIYDRDPRK